MQVGSLVAASDDFLHFFTKEGRQSLHGKSGLAYGLYSGVRKLRDPAAGGLLKRSWLGAKEVSHYTGRGIGLGWGASLGGYAMMTLPLAAFAGASAPKGHKASTFASQALPWIATGIGQAVAGAPGALVAGIAGDMVVKSAIGRGMQRFAEFGTQSARLETGGAYQDTEVAYTQRQVAARQLSGSLINARSIYGREAVSMHS